MSSSTPNLCRVRITSDARALGHLTYANCKDLSTQPDDLKKRLKMS